MTMFYATHTHECFPVSWASFTSNSCPTPTHFFKLNYTTPRFLGMYRTGVLTAAVTGKEGTHKLDLYESLCMHSPSLFVFYYAFVLPYNVTRAFLNEFTLVVKIRLNHL